MLREKLTPETWGWALAGGAPARRGQSPVGAAASAARPAAAAAAAAWQGARSCNLAVWRADLDRVDGFDADYSGWGKEDFDIIVRLLHAGVRRKDGVSPPASSICGTPRPIARLLAENERKLSDISPATDIRAQRGLSALTSAPAPAVAG